ncbi:MAG: HypC/HybG/HupF family hydrogenase formation chaperone [Pseudomonadales bacterium]|nr:HypC/HybG/HupF family hydrogenase formation chaperone [Pseudomonadales bacterium]
MCLAIPAKIIHIDDSQDNALVCLDGINVDVSLALVDDVRVNDYVLIHVGYALNKISEEEAERTLSMFHEAGLLQPENNRSLDDLAPPPAGEQDP